MTPSMAYWLAFWAVAVIALAILLRGPTRAWRRKRKYRRQMAKAAAYWKSLTVQARPKDGLHVIATMTTAPDRIHLLEPVLQALISGQSRPPDEIHLNIPYRFGLIPTIRRTPADADVWFFIVDDDVRHLPEALATLLDRAQADHRDAYGYADNYLYRRWSQPDGEVDILCGFAGFLVHRSFFKEDFESYLTKALSHPSSRFHDDVYLSNYLASRLPLGARRQRNLIGNGPRHWAEHRNSGA
ncbi:MAG: hypothetical protein EBU04_07895 [Verrucomicrobia bacterium]|nr:hypothetical protein [Verrucomicrobiota bacterium]